MRTNTTKECLVASARALLWERGYESTSPKEIMRASGAGQGSFYHHFASKKDLAAAALEEVADELIASLGATFDAAKPPMQRVEDWLRSPRKALAGCKVGRLAQESSVIDDDLLRQPLVRYFRSAEKLLRQALNDAVRAGTLSRAADVDDLASMLVSVVQGGFVLSRVHRDPNKLAAAVRAACALLAAQRGRRSA